MMGEYDVPSDIEISGQHGGPGGKKVPDTFNSPEYGGHPAHRTIPVNNRDSHPLRVGTLHRNRRLSALFVHRYLRGNKHDNQ